MLGLETSGGIKTKIFFIGRPKAALSNNELSSTSNKLLVQNEVCVEPECIYPKVNPKFVTNIKNGVSNSPYNLRVTGKWTVQNRNRRPFLKCSSVLWICSLLLLLGVNAYYLHSVDRKCQECAQAVIALNKMVKHLEREAQYSEKLLNEVRSRQILPTTKLSKFPRPRLSNSDISTMTELSEFPFHPTDDSLARFKRSDDEGRSELKDRKKNRRNRTRSKETAAVQFSGSKPYGFSMVPSEGILGPWIESTNDFSNIEKFGARLNSRNSTLEVYRDGLYMIYAQVTYQSINVTNSYMINVIPNTDRSLSQPITTCSSFGKIVKDGEISCYTSVVKRLNTGDVIYVQQAQPNREIIFSKTYTYFGLIFLN